MPSWDAISNFMAERQENRDMGQFDHVRMGAQGFVYPEQQPLELSEDQPDQFGSPQAFITAGGGLDEQLDTRPSATAVEPTMRDDLRVGTMNFLQDQFGMDQFQARRFSEQLIGSAGELSATPLGIGVADLLPITAAPLTMQEGAQQFSEGMETGSGTDMAVGGVISAFGALESLPVFGAGFKMLNKAAQVEIVQDFLTEAVDAFRQTGEVTQDTLIEAGEAAQARLDSMMSGTTLSANPVGAAGDAMIAGAGRMAGARRSAETDKMVADDLVNRPELWGEGAPDINERRALVDAMLRGERFEGDEGVARLFNEHTERLSIEQAEPAPVFYSAVANAVDALPMEKGNAAQMRAMIAKSAEVKPEEMAWIGLDDFLKGKKSVTKQEIKEFVDANQVRIEEVVKAGDYPQRTGDEWQALIMQAERRQDFDEAQRLTAEWEAAEGFGGRGSPKFSDYTLPGGENYREVLLRLPTTRRMSFDEFLDSYKKRFRDNAADPSQLPALDVNEVRRMYDEGLEIPSSGEATSRPEDVFAGGHFDEPNVLAHMRLNDRTGPNGEKILFVEEIQSDWHQKGRKQGYKTPENEAKLDALKAQRKKILEQRDADAPDWFDRYEELRRERGAAYPDASQISEAKEVEFRNLSQQKAEFDAETKSLLADVDSQITSMIANIPDAPLKKTWHEMSFRRIARMAAEEGYDAIAFTPGKLQAERYDLSKQVGLASLAKEPDGKYMLYLEDVKGERIRSLGNGQDWYNEYGQQSVTPDELVNLVGKDVADKLLSGADEIANAPSGSKNSKFFDLRGNDLQVGGEGMKGFYDKMLKGYAAKWGKKFGAKVGVTEIITNPKPLSEYEKQPFIDKEQVWTLPVTKKMRDSVLSKGVATFGAAGVAAGLNNEARPNGD